MYHITALNEGSLCDHIRAYSPTSSAHPCSPGRQAATSPGTEI